MGNERANMYQATTQTSPSTCATPLFSLTERTSYLLENNEGSVNTAEICAGCDTDADFGLKLGLASSMDPSTANVGTLSTSLAPTLKLNTTLDSESIRTGVTVSKENFALDQGLSYEFGNDSSSSSLSYDARCDVSLTPNI